MVQYRNENVEYIGTLQDVVQKFFVVVAHLPEKDEQLLMKVYLLRGIRKVCLHHRIVQQPRDALQDELKVW